MEETQHHEEHYHIIGLIPSIILLIAIAVAVVWYSMYTAAPHMH